MVDNNTFNKIVVSKHSRNGSVNEAKLSHNQLRSHCVSVRFNDEELQPITAAFLCICNFLMAKR